MDPRFRTTAPTTPDEGLSYGGAGVICTPQAATFSEARAGSHP